MTKTNKAPNPATTAKARAATAAKLVALSDAIIATNGNRKLELAALKSAGGNQPKVREQVIATRMAVTLFPGSNLPAVELVEKGREILARPGAKTTKPKRKTAAQEQAYAAARTYWSRLLKEAGIVTTDTRGGANNKGKPKTGANKPDAKPVGGTTVAIPAAVNKVEVHKFLQDMAALLVTFANKNGKAMDVRSRNLITSFAEDAGQLDK